MKTNFNYSAFSQFNIVNNAVNNAPQNQASKASTGVKSDTLDFFGKKVNKKKLAITASLLSVSAITIATFAYAYFKGKSINANSSKGKDAKFKDNIKEGFSYIKSKIKSVWNGSEKTNLDDNKPIKNDEKNEPIVSAEDDVPQKLINQDINKASGVTQDGKIQTEQKHPTVSDDLELDEWFEESKKFLEHAKTVNAKLSDEEIIDIAKEMEKSARQAEVKAREIAQEVSEIYNNDGYKNGVKVADIKNIELANCKYMNEINLSRRTSIHGNVLEITEKQGKYNVFTKVENGKLTEYSRSIPLKKNTGRKVLEELSFDKDGKVKTYAQNIITHDDGVIPPSIDKKIGLSGGKISIAVDEDWRELPVYKTINYR